MDLFREYQPQAVIRAESTPLKIYSGEELRQICRTDKSLPIFFYDIFLSPDGKELIALQAREFSHLFLEFRVYYNSNPLEFTKKNIAGLDDNQKEVVLWKISLPYPHRDGIKISIEDDSTGESLEVDIEPYPFAGNSVARIMQQTMQKDYPLVWLRDHILYMHRLHGIDRYVFYDNGSQDYRRLIENLQEISETEGIEILLINWPFPYTRLWRLEEKKTQHDTCVQKAAFNHGFFMLESITVYAMNLDLDEYLFNHSFLSLYTCIKIRAFLAPFIYIPASIIPNHPSAKGTSIMRASSFPYQRKGYDSASKYIYKSDAQLIGHLDIHVAHEVQVMGFTTRNIMNKKLLWYLHRVGRILLCMAVPFFQNDALVFYHFKGINTGWKRFSNLNLKKPPEKRESMVDISAKSWDVRRSNSFDPDWVPFDYIKKAFKKIGLDE